jgi:signal transduction histidine kinase
VDGCIGTGAVNDTRAGPIRAYFHRMRLRNATTRLSSFLERQQKYVILAGCLAAVMIIGMFDYVLPYAVSMSIFYSAPIMIAAWYADKKNGDLVAIVSLIITWWTDELTAPPGALGWIHTYRMIARLLFYLFFSMGAAALRARRDLSAARIELDRKHIELLERSHELEREIIRISEREQRRIGQDLHDGLCQYLAAVSCAAASLRNDLKKRLLPDESESAAEIAELLKQGVTQARNLARGLSPVYNDESGLDSALQELAAYSSRLLDIDCEFDNNPPVLIRDNAAASHLYRIAQEALNNATRHGRATVFISLEEMAGIVTLRVSDNGIGLPGNADSGGMGLKVMDYRARAIGGELRIENDPVPGGVTVSCSYRQQTPADAEREPAATAEAPDVLLGHAAAA